MVPLLLRFPATPLPYYSITLLPRYPTTPLPHYNSTSTTLLPCYPTTYHYATLSVNMFYHYPATLLLYYFGPSNYMTDLAATPLPHYLPLP